MEAHEMRLMVWVSAIWVAIAFSAWAGPEKISFPEGYQSHFVRYVTMDKPKLKAVRFLCVNPESLQTAEPNRPAPYGTVIVMQDNKAKLGPDGVPVKDALGRFVPTTEITNIFVQEKQPGWGTEYTAEKRNGEWEYAWFGPAGKPKTGDAAHGYDPKVNFDRCFACHKDQAEAHDYMYTLHDFIVSVKN
jgi:hypothetical protein